MAEAINALLVSLPGALREQVRCFLEGVGFQPALPAVDSLDALREALSREPIDLVLLFDAPDKIPAEQVIEAVQERLLDVPIILLADSLGHARSVALMQAGVQDYLLRADLARLGLVARREIEARRARAERRQFLENTLHLNRVLRAIRNVNQLIVREKDPDRVIDGACQLLVETRGYLGAWIAVGSLEGAPERFACRGWPAQVEDFQRMVRKAHWPDCTRSVAAQAGGLLFRNPEKDCPGCPLAGGYVQSHSVVVAMRHQERWMGALGVAFPAGADYDAEEESLLREVAGDIAFALDDITAQRARAEREEIDRRFQVFFENAPIGKSMTGLDGRLLRVNPALCRMLGRTAGELERLTWRDITHPDDLAESEECARALLAGETDRWEMNKRYLAKSGKIVQAHVTTALMRNREGEPQFFLTHIVDQTERVELEARLTQADRLASTGMLAAGVAHEINNPLSFVLFNLESISDMLSRCVERIQQLRQALVEKLGHAETTRIFSDRPDLLEAFDFGAARDNVREALDGAQRIREIVRGLKAFSRVDADKPEPIAVEDAIRSALTLCRNELKYRARVVADFAATSPVLASEGRLSQVFLNLLINAAHAIPEGNVAGNKVLLRTFQEGDTVCVEVSDTGCGMPKEVFARLFEPFFTTKPKGIGSGLGLHISKNIVQECGGTIKVESEVGKGTRFLIRLPAFAGETRPGPNDTVQQPEKKEPAGRVFVVDDEPGIRKILTRLLDAHQVVTAGSGLEAKALLEADANFDVILCDLMMQDFSGVDLHRWLRQARPDLARRLIFMTGGVFTPAVQEYLDSVDNLRLEKPIDAATLKRLVADRIVIARSRQPM
jgi:PAS domain S-box-containing protein